MAQPRIALISNPKSTGNLAQLPRIRAFCAERPDIFHYEVEKADQVGEAMRTIARIDPRVLVINGGDGTVQAALTEIYNGRHFKAGPPPVAVLPSGKTNLIALDLGAQGDPIAALEQLLEVAKSDLAPHIVARDLIALEQGEAPNGTQPVIGMFLGGGGLADTMLYCRHKIYPLGLPNGFSHFITAVAVLLRQIVRLRASFLPPDAQPLSVSVRDDDKLSGRFSLLLVTTLDKLLVSGKLRSEGGGHLKLLAIEQRPVPMLRAVLASIAGRLGRTKLSGVHVEQSDEIRIEGERSSVILDGELFEADIGRPIVLRPTSPLSFVRLAA